LIDQQAILLVHRLRQACVAEHTRLVNRLRGFLVEFGIVVPKGANTFKDRWPIIRQRHDRDLPALAWETLDALYGKLGELHQQVLAYDRQINAFVRQDERSGRCGSGKKIFAKATFSCQVSGKQRVTYVLSER
jgi:transposase